MDQGGVESQDKERQPADDEGDEDSAHSESGLPLLPRIMVWSWVEVKIEVKNVSSKFFFGY
jgi:hypothetical protein